MTSSPTPSASGSSRESELIVTFTEMADTLLDDFDVAGMLHRLVTRCAQTLGATDAAILLSDAAGTFEVAATTSEHGRLMELLQLDVDQGPCLEAHRTGQMVSVDDLIALRERWPRFATAASEMGYQSIHAIPLRLRDTVIGSLNLFSDTPGSWSEQDAYAARGLADVATIGLLQERALRDADALNTQLQTALESRVIIEQAKGYLAREKDHSPAEAFEELRRRSRSTRTKLTDIARQVSDQPGDSDPSAPGRDSPAVNDARIGGRQDE